MEKHCGLQETIAQKEKLELILDQLNTELGLSAPNSGAWQTYIEQYGALTVSLGTFREEGYETPDFKYEI